MKTNIFVGPLLFLGGLCIFVQITALMALHVTAAYVFGGAAIVFAALALLIALGENDQ